jgi:hypothetical protein
MTATDISLADVHYHLCEAMVALAHVADDVGPDHAGELFEAARLLTRSAEHLIAFRVATRNRTGPPALSPPAGRNPNTDPHETSIAPR